ncbi:MAG TPA: DUF6807 family protein, partial [Acidimicrobiales bacterium]|nr:DUF6807 family protein [Acidimicrobiales bacterium]
MTRVEHHPDATSVTADDGGGFTYVHGHRRKPHLHPLVTPSGRVLTAVEPPDHPWHRGMWFTVKHVNGDNFWEEQAPYGVLRHGSDPLVVTGSRTTALTGIVDWIAPDRETEVIHDERRLALVPLAPDAVAVDIYISLTASIRVELDRTPFTTWGGYGGLALRGRPDWTDTVLRTPDGEAHERLLGVPAEWIDLTGTVDGATAGLAWFDHPDNPSAPVPWYASTRAATY